MKKLKVYGIAVFLLFWIPILGQAQVEKSTLKALKKELTKDSFRFILLNDAGHNGYKDQKVIAEVMGVIADEADVETIFSVGDQLHFKGVQSVSDPFWITNFEVIYTHPQLLKADWYAVPGNHEYRGNVDAFVNYNEISSRWKMPSRYYALDFKLKKNNVKRKLKVLMLDTTPMMDRYRKDKSDDSAQQDYQKQIQWVDSVLTNGKEDWNLVFGHHPIYANTSKNPTQQQDMQTRLNPILQKHNVDVYICGHIHNFQHIEKENSCITYIVNTSAGNSRKIKKHEGLTYGYEGTGFLLGELTPDKLIIRLINNKGETEYTITKKK